MSTHKLITAYKTITYLLALLVVLSTSGCGWQLRGQLDFPADQRNVHLSVAPNARALEQDLKREFTLNGVNLVEAGQADWLVSVTKLTEDRRVSSLGTDAVADSVNLSLLVTYSVTSQTGRMLVPPGPARVGRSYTYDRDNVAAKAQEEQTIREEIQRELAQQILRSIRYALGQPQTAPAELEATNTSSATPITETLNEQSSPRATGQPL